MVLHSWNLSDRVSDDFMACIAGRSGSRWEDNNRMDLKEIRINTKNCVDSAQDRDYLRALVNAALNLRIP